MADWSIPSIPMLTWEINGNHLTAWINDDELFDIRPADKFHSLRVGTSLFDLHINSVSHATSVYLGTHTRIVDAQQAADRHIGNEEAS